MFAGNDLVSSRIYSEILVRYEFSRLTCLCISILGCRSVSSICRSEMNLNTIRVLILYAHILTDISLELEFPFVQRKLYIFLRLVNNLFDHKYECFIQI